MCDYAVSWKSFSAFPVILLGTPEIFQHPINLACQPESGFRSHGISRRYSSSFLKQSAKLQKSCGIPPPSFRIPCLRWHKSANYMLSWQIRLAEPLLGSAKLSKRLPPHVANCPPFLPLCLMANAGRCAFVSAPRADALLYGINLARKELSHPALFLFAFIAASVSSFSPVCRTLSWNRCNRFPHP